MHEEKSGEKEVIKKRKKSTKNSLKIMKQMGYNVKYVERSKDKETVHVISLNFIVIVESLYSIDRWVNSTTINVDQ